MMKWRKNEEEKWRRRCVRTSTAASLKLGRGSFHERRKIPFLRAFLGAFGSSDESGGKDFILRTLGVRRIVIIINNSNN